MLLNYYTISKYVPLECFLQFYLFWRKRIYRQLSEYKVSRNVLINVDIGMFKSKKLQCHK